MPAIPWGSKSNLENKTKKTWLEFSQNFSKYLKISQNFSKSLKISQNLSKSLKIRGMGTIVIEK
jgi:hypothetical protein